MLFIADPSYGCLALQVNHANFTRWQKHLGILTLFGHEPGKGTGTSHHLPALFHLELNVVNPGSKGNVFQRKAVSRFNICAGTGLNEITNADFPGSQNVSFFTVCIHQKCNTCASVGIVFNGRDFGWNAILVPLEIDDAVMAFSPTALVPTGYSTPCTLR
eukprot:TRINITY_DN1902_c0_g1_i1.p2 TRINITY_DN1902_c0_g1~~TRINITY_DN1902_c0_g1_i1.p2  ORF type:complete len:160 (+),score=8.45 TRINITY_DN1902_c0_g1_i1:222-701(+)